MESATAPRGILTGLRAEVSARARAPRPVPSRYVPGPAVLLSGRSSYLQQLVPAQARRKFQR